MGPYYLTALVNLLGPAKSVVSISNHNTKKRIIGIGPKKGKRIKVEDLSQQNKDFLTEVNKEKEELEASMQESFRQRDERVAREKKRDIQKLLEENKITNFKTPEQEMAQRLEDDKYREAKNLKTDLSGIPFQMTPEEEDRNAGVERDENGNVKSEETR